ncbi:hypothetical protein FOL47_007746 [Perkinsus chesapeaki]|uniref:EamA domain-containing protein n=1 Tax=Perkinsus chesapeaki TaxID=330153 RepID=A0A7J6MUZ7_PERCH|nr:hypothetical protein FOL47_007746 [Perkinsus chesapeaki]
MSTAAPAVVPRRWSVAPATWAYILLLINIVIGAGWEVLSKLVLSNVTINVLTLAFYRQILSAVVLLGLLDRTFKLPKREDVSSLAKLGIFTSLGIICFFKGIRLATPIICSLLHPTFLVFCYFFGLIQGSETYSRHKVGGVALCVGAAMAASLMGEELRQSTGELNWSVLFGTLLLMGGTIFAALMVVYQRESFHLPLVYVEGYAYVFASVVTLVLVTVSQFFCLVSGSECADMTFDLGLVGENGKLHFEGWLLLLYGVVLMSCVLYCTINWANRQTSPAVVASFATLQPVGTGAVQYLATGKQVISLAQVAMYLFAVVGVILVSFGPPTSQQEMTAKSTEYKTAASDVETGDSEKEQLE